MFKRFTVAFLLTIASAAALHAGPVRLKITLADKIEGVTMPVSGRLLIFMRKDDGKPTDGFGVNNNDPDAVWISGAEVSNMMPGRPIEIDPDVLSFPSPFASAPAGEYQIFALLDRDHSYTYGGPAGGDLYSEVLKTTAPLSFGDLTLQ